jgi:hypothetical protein
MNSLDRVYERTAALRQLIRALASQRSELDDLRNRVRQAEQRSAGRARSSRRAIVAGRSAPARSGSALVARGATARSELWSANRRPE